MLGRVYVPWRADLDIATHWIFWILWETFVAQRHCRSCERWWCQPVTVRLLCLVLRGGIGQRFTSTDTIYLIRSQIAYSLQKKNPKHQKWSCVHTHPHRCRRMLAAHGCCLALMDVRSAVKDLVSRWCMGAINPSHTVSWRMYNGSSTLTQPHRLARVIPSRTVCGVSWLGCPISNRNSTLLDNGILYFRISLCMSFFFQSQRIWVIIFSPIVSSQPKDEMWVHNSFTCDLPCQRSHTHNLNWVKLCNIPPFLSTYKFSEESEFRFSIIQTRYCTGIYWITSITE